MTDAMSGGEYSTRGRPDPPPATIAETLAAAAHLAPDGHGRLHAPLPLQSWPGIVHGGGLVALLDSAAVVLGGATAPRLLEGRLTAPIPTETTLVLDAYADNHTVRLTILRDGQTLGAGAISPLDAAATSTPTAWRGGGEGWPLPVSEHCLA